MPERSEDLSKDTQPLVAETEFWPQSPGPNPAECDPKEPAQAARCFGQNWRRSTDTPPILPRTLQHPQPLCRGPLGWGVGLVTESVPRPSRGTAFVSRIKNQYLAQLGLPLRIHSTVKWIHDPGHTHERLLCVRHPSEPIL